MDSYKRQRSNTSGEAFPINHRPVTSPSAIRSPPHDNELEQLDQHSPMPPLALNGLDHGQHSGQEDALDRIPGSPAVDAWTQLTASLKDARGPAFPPMQVPETITMYRPVKFSSRDVFNKINELSEAKKSELLFLAATVPKYSTIAGILAAHEELINSREREEIVRAACGRNEAPQRQETAGQINQPNSSNEAVEGRHHTPPILLSHTSDSNETSLVDATQSTTLFQETSTSPGAGQPAGRASLVVDLERNSRHPSPNTQTESTPVSRNSRSAAYTESLEIFESEVEHIAFAYNMARSSDASSEMRLLTMEVLLSKAEWLSQPSEDPIQIEVQKRFADSMVLEDAILNLALSMSKQERKANSRKFKNRFNLVLETEIGRQIFRESLLFVGL